MPEDDSEQPATPLAKRYACVFVVGFFVTGFIGMGLAFAAAAAKAPAWMFFAGFFGPFVVVALIVAAFFGPRIARSIREANLNEPSPESTAAPAAGEGVEAGTRARRTGTEDPKDFPTVDVIDTQPGKVLAHRLPQAGMPVGCQLGCIGVFAIIWNSVVSTFLFQTIEDWNRGRPIQWGGLLFLSPFLLIGLILIGVCFYLAFRLFVSLLVGRVEVEVSEHPIAIGATVSVQIAQVGLVPLNRVKLLLVCTEEATYVAGTSQSTAKHEAETKLISHPDEDATGGRLPLAAEFVVPADAMHSFLAPNNKIVWTIRVAGRVLGLLPYHGDFSTTVRPG